MGRSRMWRTHCSPKMHQIKYFHLKVSRGSSKTDRIRRLIVQRSDVALGEVIQEGTFGRMLKGKLRRDADQLEVVVKTVSGRNLNNIYWNTIVYGLEITIGSFQMSPLKFKYRCFCLKGCYWLIIRMKIFWPRSAFVWRLDLWGHCSYILSLLMEISKS